MKRTVLRRSTESLVRDAMDALVNMPCGGIGRSGYTIDELDEFAEAGNVADDDATYHQAQLAWRLLERALENL